MSTWTKAKTAKPYKSGFCTKGNPDDSHDRCPRQYQGRPCICDCHVATAPPNEEKGEAGTISGSQVPATHAAPVDLPLGLQVVGSAIPDNPHGFHADVDEEEYHRHPGSLSVTGAKLLLKAPALFRHEQANPSYKRTWDVGSGAHKEVLGVGPEIVVVQKTTVDRKTGDVLDVCDADDYRTDSAKAHRDEIRAAGKLPLLRSEATQVRNMADALSSNTLAMDLLSQGQPEISAFCEDEPTGVMRRCRFDWLAPVILNDVKTTVNADPRALGRTMANFGYFQQASWYTDLARDLGHPAQAFAFIFIEKDEPYLTSVVELDAEALDLGRRLNRRALDTFAECMKTGVWPGYQQPGTYATVSLPRWAYLQEEVS